MIAADHRWSRPILTVLALAMGVPTLAQSVAELPAAVTSSPPSPNATTTAFMALMNGNYLAAIDGLRAAVSAGDASAQSSLEQVEPFVTGYPALPPPRTGDVGLLPGTIARIKQAKPLDAIAAIVERARKTRIVILNEAHDEPRHRAFGLEVARALRPLGYTLLAMEALPNDADPRVAASSMARLAADGYARRGTGFYIMDPVFADFIRQALAIGYRPLAYEETTRTAFASRLAGVVAREQEQATNLARHISAAGPDAKILIYVGYSHAAEAPIAFEETTGNEWMAARLKRMTRIDPLTINQTDLREATSHPASRAAYDLIAPRLGRKPGVMILQGEPLKLGPDGGAFDLQVIHPRRRAVNGRPDWLAGMGRQPVRIPAHLLPAKGRRLVQAFDARETVLPIPLDHVLVEAGQPVPRLMLPDVPIRYATQDR